MQSYLDDLPAFVVKVKRWLAIHAASHLTQMQYGYQREDAYELGWKLLSSLQALSYLQETPEGDYRAFCEKQIVSYILTLIDLEDVELEPYNLYYRPTISTETAEALYGNDAFVDVNGNYLRVGTGVYVKERILPTVFPTPPSPTCC